MSLLVEGAARGKEFIFNRTHIIHDIPLVTMDNPTFDQGKKAEKAMDWDLALKNFYSVFLNSENPYDQARSGIEVSQMLTNFNRLGQASKLLDEVETKLENISGTEGDMIRAKLHEKRAWIDGYMGFFDEELYELQESEVNLMRVSPDHWSGDHRNLESTIGHFRGRANYAKGVMSTGKERQELLNLSLGYFVREKERLESWRLNGNPQPANEGYQHLWMSKVHLMMPGQANIRLAEEEEVRARKLFEESGDPEIVAHSFMLQGAIQIKKGHSKEALSLFETALEIRQQKEHSIYSRGVAEAYGGIAVSYFSEGKMGYYAIYASEAIKILAFGS